MVKSAGALPGTSCRRSEPLAVQLRGSPSTACTFAANSPTDTGIPVSTATRNRSIGPAPPSTGPCWSAYAQVPGPDRGTLSTVGLGGAGRLGPPRGGRQAGGGGRGGPGSGG